MATTRLHRLPLHGYENHREIRAIGVAVAAAAGGMYLYTTYADADLPTVTHAIGVDLVNMVNMHKFSVTYNGARIHVELLIGDDTNLDELEYLRGFAFRDVRIQMEKIDATVDT